MELLSSKDYCISIGAYEKNVDYKITDFLNRKKIKLTNNFIKKFTNIDTDMDNNFNKYLLMLNNELKHMELGICTLFNDVYCEGVFTLFVHNKKFIKEIYNKLADSNVSIYK